ISDRGGVMYLGKIVELAHKDQLYEQPKHPYTEALLSTVQIPDPDVEWEIIILEGDLPSPATPRRCCAFHTLCTTAMNIWQEVRPEFKEREEGHFVACHLHD